MLMASYLDDIQKFDKDSNQYINHYNSLKVKHEFSIRTTKPSKSEIDSNESEYFCNKRKEILNRLNELNSEKVTSDVSLLMTKNQGNADDYDTFMLELDEFERFSTKKIKDNSQVRPFQHLSSDTVAVHHNVSD